jgi:hypothetical protein
MYALVYPLLTVGLTHGYPAAPTFGVLCPTAILTIGVFADGPRGDARLPGYRSRAVRTKQVWCSTVNPQRRLIRGATSPPLRNFQHQHFACAASEVMRNGSATVALPWIQGEISLLVGASPPPGAQWSGS